MSQHEDSQFEILKESPILGDGKFKLEIGGALETPLYMPLTFFTF